ncbi:MAG: acetoacetate decarboxylase family protein [Deltaproteobacteria bacterium]|nr:acetoacetate decarboxylase family protein [Deltaproteobacteria bacterium]
MSDHSDPFFQVPQNSHATTQGDVDLPILYFDASTLLAFFVADRDAAEAKLSSTGLRPALTIAGRALVGVAHYEYRRTGVGTYNEVGVALPVLPEGAPAPRNPIQALYGSVDQRHLGFHILDLPVTTPAANAAGRELWGYPKFVAPIPFHLTRKSFESSVTDPDGNGDIFTLSGRLLPSLPVPPMSLVLYSHHQGDLFRTIVNVRGRANLRPGRSLQLRVGESTHRMANNLRDLGLDGARPLIVMDTHRFQSRLNAGVPVAKIATRAATGASQRPVDSASTQHSRGQSR